MAVLLELLCPRDLYETGFEYTKPVPEPREITNLRGANDLGSKSCAECLDVDGRGLIKCGQRGHLREEGTDPG